MQDTSDAYGHFDVLDARLRPTCVAYLQADHVPGASVAIVASDKAYHFAHGVKSVASGGAVTAATGFDIASCSKAFTSAVIASLAADGLIGWDDPIQRYVSEFALYDPAIAAMTTLRDLSANRLGLPRVGLVEYGMDPDLPVERRLAGLRHTAPTRPFRDGFSYVNVGHIANAIAVGRATGDGFLPTLRRRILQPLGMLAASGGADASDVHDVAAWHVIQHGRAVAIDTVFSDQSLGSGAMVVNGADAVRWLRLHLNGGLVDGVQIIPRDALLETHRPHSVATPGKDFMSLFYPDARMASYALGWAVSDFEGRRLVCHSGGDFGVSAQTLLLPDDGIGIAVYTNAASRTATTLAYAIASILLGLPPRDWTAYFVRKSEQFAPPEPAGEKQAARPSGHDTLSDLAGRYEHPADGCMVIDARPDGLTGHLQDGYRAAFKLIPDQGARFRLTFDYAGRPDPPRPGDQSLEFVSADGRLIGAELRMASDDLRYFHRVLDGA